MWKNIAIVAVVMLLAGLAVFQNMKDIKAEEKEAVLPAEAAPRPNYLAPPFQLKGLDGKVYEVGGKREKPLLLNFWASWCGPCETEAPDLARLYEKYNGQFDLYAVNLTKYDSVAEAKAFAEKHKFAFPVLLDEELAAAQLYRFTVIPTSFLIDRNGVIVEVINLLEAKELEKKIKSLINN